jgi:hypothetical protein
VTVGERNATGGQAFGPGQPTGWGYHYRIRIPRIPRKSNIELVAVLAWFTPPPHNFTNNRKLLGPQRLPRSIKLTGQFKASGKPINVDISLMPVPAPERERQ